ncbi:MAG TPA: conjugal transfer protein TraN [Gammaproteobacteria bacterium]|nr:conjugal transfer protein TraN [Gammaproteobacteria bacterium]|tara:strand:+ start:7577 stop:9211 length:1635 start_codon:yes stop_codon:yes gene_type:complete
MKRILALVMTFFILSPQANTVIDNLSHFNPQSVFKNYTANPKEASIKPGEGNDVLKSKGLNEVSQNKKAAELYNHVQSRGKVSPNSNSSEMVEAEKILEQADNVLKGGCYKVKGECDRTTTQKTCQEYLSYSSRQCQRLRNVSVKSSTRTITRKIARSYRNEQVVNLGLCSQFDRSCTKANTVKVSDTCEKLSVSVSAFGRKLKVKSNATCQKPVVTVELPYFSYFSEMTIKIVEYDSQDRFDVSSCNIGNQQEQCVLKRSECLNPSTTKVINGIRIYRDCWGEVSYYQCGKIAQSNCEPLFKQNCSQIKSTCQSHDNNLCQQFEQTFSCITEICAKDKEICIDKIPGSDGDSSKDELSQDFGEGVSKLGTLVGVAEDVYKNQITNGDPHVFEGNSKECKKHPLGIKDCCTGSGWGGWVVHCPKDLQDLIKAKTEGRVVSLGSYKKKKWRSRHYVYCVFPSKLAGIVQIQGRGGQLGLSFGSATAPNCQGLTPEQLERINFSRLDLSALEQDFISKKKLPDDFSSSQNNQNHIKSLYQRGASHG